MSNTSRTLLIKFVMTLIIAILAFSFIDTNPIGWVLFVAIGATIINYLIGDLLILPVFNNLIASIADGVLGGLFAFLVGLASTVFNPTAGALMIFGILIAVGEYIFHPYLTRTPNKAPEPEPEHHGDHHGEGH